MEEPLSSFGVAASAMTVGMKEPWCAGVHARHASRRLAYRRVFHPRTDGDNAMIVNPEFLNG
jgi:hypothetical protein